MKGTMIFFLVIALVLAGAIVKGMGYDDRTLVMILCASLAVLGVVVTVWAMLAVSSNEK